MPLVSVAGAPRVRVPLLGSICIAAALLVLLPRSSVAQSAQPPQTAQTPPTAITITCASTAGARNACSADTSAGVVLMRSTGQGPCLLGKTWGYDQTSIWVSEGCSGEFVTGRLEVA